MNECCIKQNLRESSGSADGGALVGAVVFQAPTHTALLGDQVQQLAVRHIRPLQSRPIHEINQVTFAGFILLIGPLIH